MPRKIRNLLNQRFGRLLVIESVLDPRNRTLWKCICDCGNFSSKPVRGDHLINGETKSCGCLRLETIKLTNSIEPGEASFNSLYNVYKHSAKDRKLEFNISKENFRKLTESNCYYCGVSPSTVKKYPATSVKYIYNGLDRLNNNLGYIDSNCVSCCTTCNYSKRFLTEQEFKSWLSRVVAGSWYLK